jgi:hypothetical protein
MRNLLPPLLFLFFVRSVFGQGEICRHWGKPGQATAYVSVSDRDKADRNHA